MGGEGVCFVFFDCDWRWTSHDAGEPTRGKDVFI